MITAILIIHIHTLIELLSHSRYFSIYLISSIDNQVVALVNTFGDKDHLLLINTAGVITILIASYRSCT